MKKVFLIVFLIFNSGILFAQNTFPYPASGNIGIGTNTPASTLDVNGAISVKGYNVSDTQIISVPADGTYVIASGSRIKGTYTINFEAANRIQTLVLLASAVQYDYGNSSLSVISNTSYGGSVVIRNFRYVFNSDASVVYLVFDILNRNGGTSVTAHFEGTGAYLPNWGGTLPASPVTAGNYPLVVNFGNIGIGTASPQNKLDVNGTIHSKAVLIDLIGWNDYVFKKDYRLALLSEVKAYIDKHQHLPEIPSEKEMIKNGLDVSEANKLLVKKMEEMTLYMIEAKEEIMTLQKEVKQLKTRLNKR
ncbi:hypothetical protein [Mucilaginibacter kameinonensis]|uniref:hypothetical protein n=1 Tax=Mucilaginibacter kameinonensis TaxID=452286 RepID=UPI000EF7640B|nr:hypothetical protein [Mucilaginibacter kameinonensis]